ncbi:uroporphyrinogen-III C-methyltransferase [Geosporobacter ferrireducens]|uniref:uroporphyrinogen-III C-methyltransferase n=1 Tax=Geosporobacter ferrireducens TaxID=1424294 RepID=A0A1D8GNC4_9FIRM|nr:uroporphyrinogen-III C-methyltransferase [Geosporobacter ferrireducens]AOT72395.1 uroporphyrinogen-III C-methyltransferase [Geosporobacter ferrireducens]MTI56349.1 uroporphyrinogen-III C-methyltransferase [Geosporobacter ferrireducens]
MAGGKVFLIGAGPGDYKLITVKGLECIKEADVILYDRLASEKLLCFAREDAELIFVGKAPTNHAYSQEEINQLLAEKALEGKTVARLKGGDPFVFGRGGEEILELIKNQIEFEVVPGITSAIAVPAYAGIPVTHRNVSSSFHVITGHEDPTKEENVIDYEALAKVEGTLIFLMGVNNLGKIRKNLLAFGQDPNRPVAVIMRGTTQYQKMAIGTLTDIEEKVAFKGISNPSIIIVGEVVSLSSMLQWFENKPLFGKRVLVTRTREQASSLSKRIEDLGGEAIEFPTIKIERPEHYDEIDKAIGEIEKYQWIIFTSVNGVQAFFDRMKKLHFDIRLLHGAKLCAIGPATAKALEDMGFTIEYIPEEYKAEGIIEGLEEKIKEGDQVLLPRADIARELLVTELERLGANVDNVHVYRTIIPEQNRGLLLELLENEGVDIITFTSSSTVRNFIQILGEENKKLLDTKKLAVIGPITEETAKSLGLKIDIRAEEYTIDGLVGSIRKYYQR